MNCLNCNTEIAENKKFCNRSCSATYNNKNRIISQETKDKLSKSLKSFNESKEHENLSLFIEDYKKGMTQKQISEKYHIGLKTLRKILNDHNVIRPRTKNDENTICTIHNTNYSKNSNGSYICKTCEIERVSLQRKELKIKAVEYKGGKCVECGYHKCIAALEFHHTDPTVKEKNIAKYSTRQWEAVKLELDKCILVCANCHREIHENIRKST